MNIPMKKIVMLLCWIMLAQLCQGQTNIGISALLRNAAPVVSYQDSVRDSIAVKNYGPNPFAGDIKVNVGIWDTTMTYVNIIYVDSTLTGVNNFGPGDSLWISYMEHYVPQNFRIGATVVVIWPISISATTIDSVSYTVELQSGMNVIEVKGESKTAIYPNPSKDRITIDTGTGNEVEQVRIMNTSGQMLLGRIGPGGIDISGLKPGAYVVQVLLDDGSLKTYRIIKQE
jgi:hypothetical protein